MTPYPTAGFIANAPASRGPTRDRTTPRGALAIALAAAFGLLLAAAPATATMYKWVDKNGRVVYSDQPPPANVKSEIVKPPPPPVNPNAAKELVDKELETKLRDKKRAEEAQAAEKQRADAARRREICTQARGQLRGLQLDNQNYIRYNEKGEPISLDDAARREAIELQQRTVQEYCQ
jgi:hypothetical protein